MRPEPTASVAAWIAQRDSDELFLTAISEAELRYGAMQAIPLPLDRATQTRPLPSDLTAQGRPVPTNRRHQYGQHRGHRSHRAEQNGNSVHHGTERTATGLGHGDRGCRPFVPPTTGRR